jgi:hypothetical protein
MPLKRLENTRERLPSGYQFGDAIPPERARMLAALRDHVASDCRLQFCIRCQVAHCEGLYTTAR